MISYRCEYTCRIHSPKDKCVRQGSVRKTEASPCSSGVKDLNKGSEGLHILVRSRSAKVREDANGNLRSKPLSRGSLEAHCEIAVAPGSSHQGPHCAVQGRGSQELTRSKHQTPGFHAWLHLYMQNSGGSSPVSHLQGLLIGGLTQNKPATGFWGI